MKLYRTERGVWVNLSLYICFYVKNRNDDWNIEAESPGASRDRYQVIIEGTYATKEAAQSKLDDIMRWASDV